ncbi:SIMPL domain-containing protein [Nocardia puris]|uniref:26 kDa periplasmic immunogenic protein n=1 Tax=Nocardia puris TaxID=208602 RepID=A0A366DCW0_9NOCA|nr:SIMPL domain-containing protein [Nocardia puris]MBF6211221.1 SIMPL domain-containing protein [Nocardia puris]MBF6364940.1 SIMPL domain-containing protein [Nocardia puris]MBF6458726.1 SIMPL domain-containing protein [Nocardia puris]RBO87775.1 hypothetical protein DFR74_11028 [Nocardia puris]
MRPSIPCAAAAAALAVLLTGCGSSDSPAREVTVVGTGEVRGAPDILTADLGVEVTADNVSTAIGRANERASAMTDAVVAAGVPREDITTTDVTITPVYAPDGDGRTVTGYRAANSVRVVVRDLPKASAVLDAAVAAGGDETRLRSVSFDLDDDSQLLADARTRAFEDARARAQQYADLSGDDLKDVITITESTSGDPVRPERGAAADSFALEPGTRTVTFTVTVTWGLG